MAKLVFVDSSGFIAKLLEGDPNHERADDAMRRLVREGRRFLTTNYVFDEVVTRVRRLSGFQDSKRAGEAILSSTLIRRIYLGEGEEAEAWRLYLKHHDQELSFTDATSFAVMKLNGLIEALTFDRDFVRAGFVPLPGVAK